MRDCYNDGLNGLPVGIQSDGRTDPCEVVVKFALHEMHLSFFGSG